MKEDNDVHYSFILHKCQVMKKHAEVLKVWFSNIWMFGVLNNQSNITHLQTKVNLSYKIMVIQIT
jgi:predicted transcriptional regulator